MGGRGSASKTGGPGATGATGFGALTDQEKQLLRAMSTKRSDSEINDIMGSPGRDALMKIGNSIRDKLGLGPGGSIRDAAKKYKDELKR